MSFNAITASAGSKGPPACGAPIRPQFNSYLTSDRLREGKAFLMPPFTMKSKIRRGRCSVFKEVGLDDDCPAVGPGVSLSDVTRSESATQESDNESRSSHDRHEENKRAKLQKPHRRQTSQTSTGSRPWYAKLSGPRTRPKIRSASNTPPVATTSLQRFTFLALVIAVVLPALSFRGSQGTAPMNGADAGVIDIRSTSPTKVCTRWAQQAALVYENLYLYGGEAKTEKGQTENTWNNDFLTLDLSKDWDTDSPALKGLTQPDGPPAVANGYLWHDYDSLFLYGGQFSDSPYVDPAPESLWKYSIDDESWTEITNPKTSSGNNSEPGGQAVHRAAEGAGLSVPELGLSWYFGGHLDWATVPGWSNQIDRVYLKSLLEFTHPGYVNSGVDDLASGTGASSNGAFRNITEGGVQDANAFSERADGALVYVPGWGDMGVLIGLAGGTEDTFSHDLGTLDVYDIASSTWFHQDTSGDIPGVRVNPCVVIASAPDASSFQIYLFGGQNLPYGQQTQYNDMYILSIPSFSWIKVDQKDQDVPSGRAGHTCTMQDGQIIVVGGYVGEDIPCDSPGIYVFNASSLKWTKSFKAGDHKADYEKHNTVRAGSYGYTVPDAVQEVIGGDDEGGATATEPASGPATGGPFATGSAPVFTVTQAGATATVTQSGPSQTSNSDNSGNGNGKGSDDDDNDSDGINAGLVAAGVVAGVAGLLAAYLGFCAYIYRRQVRAYKQHLAVANRFSGASSASFFGAAGAARARGSRNTADEQLLSQRERAESETSDETFSWLRDTAAAGGDAEPQWLAEPKWLLSSDDSSPGAASGGTGAGSGSGSGAAGSSTAYAGATEAAWKNEDDRPRTGGSGGSADRLLGEPSFFSVVLGPRRALRVVNGAE